MEIFYDNCDLEMLGYSLQIAAYLEYYNGNLFKSKAYIDEAIQYSSILKDSLPSDHIQAMLIQQVLQDEMGHTIKSIQSYKNLLNFLDTQEHKDSLLLSGVHNNLGTLYDDIKDYTLAQIHFTKSKQLCLSSPNMTLSVNTNLIKLYSTYHPRRVKTLLDQCDSLLTNGTENNHLNDDILSHYYRAKGSFYLNNQKHNIALTYLKQAIQVDKNPITRSFTRILLSKTLIKSGYHEKGQISLILAIKKLKQLYKYRTQGLIARSYNDLIEVIDIQSGFETHKFIDSAYYYNTYPDSLGGGIHMKSEYLRTILLHFKHTDSIELLQRGVQLIHDIRHDINSIESKHSSSTRAREFYDIAISAASNKYMIQSKNKYFKMAVHWADLSKGGTLNEQIYRNRILRRYTNDSLYRKCHQLQSDIHSLRKEIISNESNSISSNNNTLPQLLLEKSNELKKLEDSISFVHPLPSTDDLYNNLQPRRAILQTYVSNHKTYLFTITSEMRHLQEVNSACMAESIASLTSYLSNPNIDQDSFIHLSHSIYKQLFPENINWKTINELIIIPDQFLNQIPFESLILKKGNSIKSCKYLFQETTIKYSLGLHLHGNFDDYEKTRVLAIAPNFEQISSSHHRSCSNGAYGQLLCNKAEVNHIQRYFETEYLLDNEASLFNISQSLPNFNFVHLATHACIDTSNYYNSAIILNKERISIYDLYNFNWHNKTVVLSACNTADGKEIKGEGVFNFARILTELGAKEIIVSLWPIDDCSTADFFDSFYGELSKASSTAEALQKARMIHFHESDKLHSQPYFWAPLILISNQSLINDQLPNSINAWSIVLVIFIGLLLLTAIFISRKKPTQRSSLTPASPQSA